MRSLAILWFVATALTVGACSSDPTTDEYSDLQGRLLDTRQQLAEVTAERDALTRSAEQPAADDAIDPIDWRGMPYSVLRGDTDYFHELAGTGALNDLRGFTPIRFTGSLGGEQHLFVGHFGEGADEDLVLIHRIGLGVTDSLMLVGGDAEGVHLGVSCVGSNPVVLFDGSRTVLRAWKTTTDGLLDEIDPSDITPAELADACLYGGG